MSRILIGSGNTDIDGLVTGEYAGSGKGRVQFVAYNKEHILLSEIYSIYDCVWYDDSTYTANTNFNRTIDTTSFALEFTVTATGNNSQCWFRLGQDTNNCNRIGLIYNQNQGIAVRQNGTDIASQYVSSRIPLDTPVNIKFTYKDGVMTYTDDNETITITDASIAPSKLVSVVVINGAVLSDIKMYNI